MGKSALCGGLIVLLLAGAARAQALSPGEADPPPASTATAGGRYQAIAAAIGFFGQSLFLVDTATGRTWQLADAPAPTANGEPGTRLLWVPLPVGTYPAAPAPVKAKPSAKN